MKVQMLQRRATDPRDKFGKQRNYINNLGEKFSPGTGFELDLQLYALAL